jgi:hypothetical protein
MDLRGMANSLAKKEADCDKLERAVQVLLAAYLIAIPFQTVFPGPLVQSRIQPPEIIFVPLFILSILWLLRNRQKLWFSPLDVGVLGWLGVNVFSALHSGLSAHVVMDLISTLYTVLLYFVVRLTISQRLIRELPDLISLMCMIAALLAIVGWCLKGLGVDNILVDEIDYYPYLGDIIGRARAFTPTSGMLANILMVGIIINCAGCWVKTKVSRRDYLFIGVLLSGFVLTLSKTVFCLIIGSLLAWHFSSRQIIKLKQTILVWITVSALSFFYIFSTYFIFTPIKASFHPKLAHIFLAGDPSPIVRWDSYQLIPTKYYVILQANLFAIKESFPWGIGPGEFSSFSEEMDRKGLITPILSDSSAGGYFPHSTPLGTLSQLGLPGLISVLFLWVLGGYGCYVGRRRKKNRGLAIGLTASLIAISISAIFTDVMRFRHAWWLLALTAVLWRSARYSKAPDNMS